MLTKVRLLSENPFDLEIQNAKPTDSIRLEKIEGLGPPDINLFMGDYARDGGVYGGRRVPPRTVVFTVSLNPDYVEYETVDGLRLLLYKTIMDPYIASDGLIVILYDDVRNDRFIEGYVEKFDGDIFSDDTTAQFTLRCPNPYIQDLLLTEEAAAGPTVPFDYEGSVETGFVTTIDFSTSSSILTLDLNNVKMYLNYAFLNNDILTIDTQRGQRRVQVARTKNISNRELTSNVATLTSAGHGYAVGDTVTVAAVPTDTFFNGIFVITAVTTDTFSYALVHANVTSVASSGTVTKSTDILYALSADSIWLELHSVSNTLKVYGAAPANVVADITEIEFRGLHWGI